MVVSDIAGSPCFEALDADVNLGRPCEFPLRDVTLMEPVCCLGTLSKLLCSAAEPESQVVPKAKRRLKGGLREWKLC